MRTTPSSSSNGARRNSRLDLSSDIACDAGSSWSSTASPSHPQTRLLEPPTTTGFPPINALLVAMALRFRFACYPSSVLQSASFASADTLDTKRNIVAIIRTITVQRKICCIDRPAIQCDEEVHSPEALWLLPLWNGSASAIPLHFAA